MKKLFARLIAAIVVLGAVAATASGQATAPSADYAGPRFPGGPDSLRALVYRSTRLTTPGPAGRMLVQFELQPDGRPHRFSMVRPPDPLKKDLVNATATALNYLEAHMPAWQPGTPDPKAAPGAEPKLSLLMDFAAAPAAQPYAYADRNPDFANVVGLLRARHIAYLDRLLNDPAQAAEFASSPWGLVTYIQMQVRYPPEALRARQQGQVYAYFEVAENGAIEHVEILGSAGRALDAEVLQVVQNLPAAASPAMLHGQPVRLYYALPIAFKLL